jgi:hypothetical protein
MVHIGTESYERLLKDRRVARAEAFGILIRMPVKERLESARMVSALHESKREIMIDFTGHNSLITDIALWRTKRLASRLERLQHAPPLRQHSY